MIKRYLIVLFLILSASITHAQWTATNGPFGGNAQRIKKAPNGTLYVVMNQKLFKSTNNGDLWSEVVPTSPTSLFLNDIMIDSDGKLYAAYWSQLFSSSDNGVTWTTVATNLFQNIQYITTIGPDNVFVIWGYTGVYVSVNKGVAWTQLTTESWSGTPGLWSNSAGDIFCGIQGGVLLKHSYQGLTSNWSSSNMTQIYNVAPSTINTMAIDATGKIYLSSFEKIYTSTNNGASFTDITTTSGLAPTYTYFSGPMAVSPDGSISLFNNGLAQVHKTVNQGASWTTVAPTTVYDGQVQASVFISASTYFLATSEGVLKTTDTGANWSTKNIGLTGATTDQIVVANTTGKIIVGKFGKGYLSSIDGGTTWTFTALPGGGYASKVLKLANGTIILYGNSQIYRSTDNGVTFNWDNVYRSYDYKIVEAANGDLYLTYQTYVAPNNVPKIAKSTDSGATWVDLAITGLPNNFPINQAAIDGTTNMIVHGYDNGTATYKTFKIVGTTATALTMPYTSNLNNVFFHNNKFYVAQFSAYYHTADLGTTWTTVGFSGNKVFPIKNATYSGIAVSRLGSLYISQDEGGTWSNTTLPKTTAYITSIATDAAGDYYASASGSPVLKFTNELLVDPVTLPPFINFNWQPLNGPFGGNVSRIEIHPDGTTLFAVSGSRLWKYNGSSWSKLEPVVVNGTIFDVDIDASGAVYVIPQLTPAATPQKIYKSVDKGVIWAPLTSTGLPASASAIRDIEVQSDGSILAFGSFGGFGKIYRSSDNGATFTERFTSTSNIFYGSGINRQPIVKTTGTVALVGLPSEGMVVSTDFGVTWTVKSLASVLDPATGFVGSYMYDKDGNILMHIIFNTTVTPWVTEIVKSTNDGTTWSVLPTPSSFYPATGFTYSKRIVTLGTGEYLMCIQSIFDCYRSADGGATWTPLGNVGDVFLWTATSGTTSYLLGSGDAGIIKTTDGGLTFTPHSQGIPHPNAIEINLSNNKDLLIGATRPYYSSDFGQNFSLATMQPAAKYLQVGDSLIGYGSRLLLKSKDGGKTWASFGNDRYLTFLTKDATGNGFYGSDGTSLSYSTDLINWTTIVLSGLPASYFITGMVIDQGGVIYAIVSDLNTDLEDVYKIVFGSATKISTVIGTTNPATIKYFNNKIYLYDALGVIYKSTDGEVWTQGSAPAGSSLVVANNYLFIPASNSVLWLSRNDGGSWQSVGDTPPASGFVPNFRNIVINEYDGYAYATLTNSVAKRSGNIVMPNDNTKPLATTYLPANNATNVGIMPTLTLTLDEITNSVATKKLRVFDLAAPAVPIETIDMSSATQNYKSWSVTMTVALSFNKTYFVVIDAGAVADIFGNTYNGISASNVWRFTTGVPPAITTLAPANNATNVVNNTQLTLTFDKTAVPVPTKKLKIFDLANQTTPVEEVLVTAGVQNDKSFTYTLTTTREYLKTYFVTFESGAFQDIYGIAHAGILDNTTWRFTIKDAPETQPPTIVYNAATFIKGQSNSLSITATDNAGGSGINASTVKIFYRAAMSSAAMTEVTIPNTAGSTFQIAVPEAWCDELGLEFYFSAADVANNSVRSPDGTGYHQVRLGHNDTNKPVIPSGFIGVGGNEADYRMFSIPYDLQSGAITTIFNELGAVDKTLWRVVQYNNSTNGYSDATTITRGTGYWINVKNAPSAIAVEAATTPNDTKALEFKMNLKAGWNLIGNPYPFTINWAAVKAASTNIGDAKTFSGAFNTDNTLSPFEAAFVFLNGTGNLDVTIPFSAKSGRMHDPNTYDGLWLLPLILDDGDLKNEMGGVGMHEQATSSFDQYDDLPLPRLFNIPELHFNHPEHPVKKFTRDIVPEQDEFEWRFTADVQEGKEIILSWNYMDLGEFDRELFLLDESRQVLVNMLEQKSYSFLATKSATFRVYYGTDLKSKVKPTSIMLGKPYPNPTTGSSSISFTLPENTAGKYDVVLDVYDMLGKKIATLLRDQFSPGFYSASWTPEQQQISNGMYIYKLLVNDNSTEKIITEKLLIKK